MPADYVQAAEIAILVLSYGAGLTVIRWGSNPPYGLVRLASNLICWSNDIFSYAKEVVRNGIVHSLPTILQHHLDIDIQEAIDRAAQMHDDEVGRYEQLERRMRDTAGPHLRRFLDDINSWIIGNVTWTHTCQRYCSHVALRPVESLLLAGGQGKIEGGLHGTEVAPQVACNNDRSHSPAHYGQPSAN
ncbi:terpene synthase family protein [Bradyrhizobium erythrophlei]|uniref:terpene synthase family protein n=1 Tax=Bradyrhizobium erythrophlei TaxID=1437360 RepID=UPI0009A74C3B|nr:hypothetical protein [Bradyrhizobium erythrophlei]